MKRERILEFVGGSEEDVAYLRLLLRRATDQLTDRWRLRREGDGHVDLLVIHDLDEGAAPASDGPRRVRLIDPVFGAAGMEIAPWPLSKEKLVRLLNLTGFAADLHRPGAPPPAQVQHNVYDDLFVDEDPGRWQTLDDIEAASDAPWLRPNTPQSAMVEEAERLFRRDVDAEKEKLRSIQLHDHIDIEATDGGTSGRESRVDRRAMVGNLAESSFTLTIEEANLRHPMSAYLGGRLLPGPASILLGEIALTVDPRNRQYYAKGALCILEDLCREQPRRGDWRTLTTFEFADVRKQIEPRPYAELRWLCVYANDDTRGANDLDEVLPFRLTERFDLSRDFPRAERVARELERGSSLNAAAVAARVPLSEARRVAAAFDELGWLVPD